MTLPHTWNATDAATTVQSTPSTPLYKRSMGWHQLEFDGGARSSGTKWLQFDAASTSADVWLNGVKLGQHRGAFTAFRFNVTNVLKPGPNVLVVKTDFQACSSWRCASARTPNRGWIEGDPAALYR